MKANELRIGNYVKPKNGYSQSIRVKYIAQDGEIYSNSDMGQCEYAYTVSQVLPIPLTGEWLVKLGFSMAELDMYHIFHEKSGVGIKYHRDAGGYIFSYGISQVPIFHVHQLQNLYFALTGEELEIKNNNKSSNVPE